MGDVRFVESYERLRDASDRALMLRSMDDDDLVAALAASSRAPDPFLANVVATELLNRVRRLRAALQHLGEGVAALGADGAIQWLNPAGERLLGWGRNEVMGRDFHELVQHRDAAGARIPRERCAVERIAITGEFVTADGDLFATKDQGDICVSLTGAPIRDPDGGLQGIVLAFADCTERKRAERAVRESEQKYRSLFDHSLDGVVSVAPDGTILDSNRAAAELTGVPAEAARGRPFTEFLHPEDVSIANAFFAEVAGGAAHRAILRVIAPDGAYYPAQAIGVPIVIDGKVVGVHGVVRRA